MGVQRKDQPLAPPPAGLIVAHRSGEVPTRLISEITNGNCVAFVGAGFSAPAVPQWKQLILDLAASGKLEGEAAARVRALVREGSSRDLEAAAQTVRDALGEDTFLSALQHRVGNPPRQGVMRRRLELLNGIPFRAVLTTNFDGLLAGRPPGRDAYLDVLRPHDHRWWDRRYWDRDKPGSTVVKLHGDAATSSEIVFTQRDYRRRLYTSPAYGTFLRSIMSTTTVLYLGFSFGDAYLNELRSEILALLDHRGGDAPVGYAVVADATPAEIRYSRDHEGIETLTFPTGDPADYSGFDRYLEAMYLATNPRLVLGKMLAGKRIVWVDPSDRSPQFGMRFLRDAAESAGKATSIDQVASAEEGLSMATERADLILTHWGHGLGPDGGSVAEYLLRQVRTRDLEVPTMVFASGDHADANKVAAMKLGATSYEYTWEGLFQEIGRIFTPGSQIQPRPSSPSRP